MPSPHAALASSSLRSKPVFGLLRCAAARLEAAGIESAALDARLILAYALGITREALAMGAREEATPVEVERFDACIARRAAHEPVAKILGRKAFWKHEFEVTRDTLDPRPETETVLEAVLKCFSPSSQASPFPEEENQEMMGVTSILDLGTGSGSLLISLLLEFPQARGVGTDISSAALAVAGRNARRIGISPRARFMHTNWADGVAGNFDVIVSNPPYIPSGEIAALAPDVRIYDPSPALDGGEDGLDAYRAVFSRAAERLVPGGILALEIGAGQAEAVAAIGGAHGWRKSDSVCDLAGIERAMVFRYPKILQ